MRLVYLLEVAREIRLISLLLYTEIYALPARFVLGPRPATHFRHFPGMNVVPLTVLSAFLHYPKATSSTIMTANPTITPVVARSM